MQNRAARRPLPAFLASVVALGILPWAAQVVACSTDAVGVDACRTIETKRCQLAPKCASVKGSPKIKTTTQVTNCISYYHDHCLVGIENTTKGDPSKASVDACVGALDETAKCAATEETMASCDKVDVDDATMSPCEVLNAPEHLKLCNFIEKPASTSSTTATTSTGTGGSGGSGGSGG